MSSVVTRSYASARRPLSALSTLVMGTLAATSAALIYLQAMIIGQLQPPLAIFAGLLLVAAALVATGWRWAPLVGVLVSALVVAGSIGHIIYDLSHPEAIHTFAFNVVTSSLVLVSTVGGVAATLQNYRSAERGLPRVARLLLVALVAFGAGAVAVATIPRQAAAGIAPELLAQLPAVSIPGMSFAPQQLEVRAGEQVAFRLDNAHGAPHSFDVDELNVHVPVAPAGQSLILFTPSQPGTYTFYCGVPGHREAGMVGTLVVR